MWTFVEVARIAQAWSRWEALVTLSRNGVNESYWLYFLSEPTQQQVATAGAELVARFNEVGAETEVDDLTLPAGLSFQTAAQFAARFRARFRDATREQCARMAYWLIERIAGGDFTDTQVRNAFGLTTNEYTAAKARFQALHDHWAAILAAAGE